ncbi:hypothetical protein [Alloalcanivorax marinus]|uniref:hypothetical protein n=1 Tax=Alloalcanivorax marinus TaxID=1177169 RepID=UPI0019325A43|nr:hypothetical protein [Alloalcanivorax marinus]MBL7250079.1 hypothetical protein [Alloalcanivorax marinus]
MAATFVSTWRYMWPDVWARLQLASADEDQEFGWLEEKIPLPEGFDPHDDLYSEIFRAAYSSLSEETLTGFDMSEVIGDPELAVEFFIGLTGESFSSENAIIQFLEAVVDTLAEFDDVLPGRYLALMSYFTQKYSLRYVIDDQGKIYPSVTGIFSELMSRIDRVASGNEHLASLTTEMHSALYAIKADSSQANVKVFVHKFFNLAEALACGRPEVKGKTLGDACKQIQSWPHVAVKNSLSSLYGFASNYPGMRHAGSPESKLRDLDMRDLVSMSVILAGYMPYLADELVCEDIYIPGRRIALAVEGT